MNKDRGWQPYTYVWNDPLVGSFGNVMGTPIINHGYNNALLAHAQRFKVPKNLPNYDNQDIHFGFLIGINILDFKITPSIAKIKIFNNEIC